MKIYCITGKAGHGKDTVASVMKSVLESDDNRVLIIHYADLLKFICEKFFDWDGKKDEPGRALLQYVGQRKIHEKSPDYLIDFVVSMLEIFEDEWDYVIIPDCRRPSEYEILAHYGYDVRLIRVVRPEYESGLTSEQQSHPTETEMDTYPCLYTINNDAGRYELGVKVLKLFSRERHVNPHTFYVQENGMLKSSMEECYEV